MPLIDWDGMEKENLGPLLARKVFHGERLTVAQIFLSKGSVVPEHSHDNEQFTTLLSGKLLFVIDGEEQELAAGQSMHIPSNAVHVVTALEDSLAVDVFIPVRQDWISGDDAYLRG